MSLNKISLGMLEKKVAMDASVAAGVLKILWSDGTTTTYTPPAGQSVDLSNYYTKAEADSRFLTKAQADQLYDPLGSGGGVTPTGGNVDTWTQKLNGLTWTAAPGGLGGWWSGNLYNNWGNGIYRIDGNMFASNGGLLSAGENTIVVIVGAGGTSHNFGFMPQAQTFTLLSGENQTTDTVNTLFYFTSGYVQINGTNSGNVLRVYKLS